LRYFLKKFQKPLSKERFLYYNRVKNIIHSFFSLCKMLFEAFLEKVEKRELGGKK